MFVGLLGSFEVRLGDRPVTPSAPKLRTVLALLALSADSVVHLDQLVEELWEHNPPGSPSTTLQTYVYQLRKLLAGAYGPVEDTLPNGVTLLTRSQGYEFRLSKDSVVDVQTFETLLERGRRALDGGRTEEAAQLLRDALGQWRGPAFGGITTGPVLSARATHLEESRKSALELRFEADLALGRHRRVVDELAGVVKAQPTHEGFSAKLMTALYRCGRRVEALEVFQRLRSEFVAQLGLEPSLTLNALHQSVLTDDPALVLPASTVRIAAVPAQPEPEPEPAPQPRPIAPVTRLPLPAPEGTIAQIPPATFHFVGRHNELALLTELIGAAATDDRHGLRMAEVTGPPGVGKSTLVVTAAHHVRRSFPDGQVFVDLRPVNDGAESLHEVLAGALRSAGVPLRPGQVTAAEIAYSFRSWSAERRVLVVADDVMSIGQLDGIRPSGPGSAMLVASRRRLHCPGAVSAIELAPLSISEGVQLLQAVLGEARVREEREHAAELVELCLRLPLVISAIGGRLAYRRRWTLARMRYRVAADPGVLLRVRTGGATLRDTLVGNYRTLTAQQRAAFLAVAAQDEDFVDERVLAELLATDTMDAEELLEALADSYLLEEVMDLVYGSTTRYRITKPLRLIAAEVLRPARGCQSEPVLQSGFSPSSQARASLVDDSDEAVVDHGPAGRSLTG
ncbi:AfsR/SARP family transcriptional regulator [Kutzneria viridogrisea]|uniref:DNA-binding SARP family transcriptional activator n=1 Tax=Kutzneria viridogrisea TaxID=47990 RepID=A0ABR6BHT6_9PSEU|nr:DNA-binding SARP family transcriptional activator [Kutzneria viridogrisea]